MGTFRLPQYTSKDVWIFAGIMPFIVVFINVLLFDSRYFREPGVFVYSSFVTLCIMSVTWIGLTGVAVILRERFPDEKEVMKRICVSIFFFAIITALTFSAIFYGYDQFHFLNYKLNEGRFQTLLISGVVLNIFTTFLHEGVLRFEKWKTTVTETEQLKKEYMQSCLLGLKSQVNPHFLFNSLNSLSGLISDDTQKAEYFLNEMSKVYRYLLRNNEEQLVTLQTELSFIGSYYYVLSTRYGEGFQLVVNVKPEHKELLIPPLTLQILVEHAFNHNSISKEQPLTVKINSLDGDKIEVANNIQQRVTEDLVVDEAGIENTINKYKLLGQYQVRIKETKENLHVVSIPLIKQSLN